MIVQYHDCTYFRVNNKKIKMCNNLPGSCLQPKEFYVCSCLFDEMLKAKYSSLRSHEEIVVRLTAMSIVCILCLLIILVTEQSYVIVVQQRF